MGEHRTEQKRRMRAASLLAAAMVGAMALSGCSLVSDGQQVLGILQAEAAQQEVLKSAVDELRDLAAVEEATSLFVPDGPQGDEADIRVVATAQATSAELTVMALVVHEAFTSTGLHQAVSQFTLEIAEGGTLTQSTFDLTESQLEAEVGYWVAVEDAIGVDAIGAALSLNLVQAGGEPPYQRQFRPPPASNALHATDQFIANYATLQAVPDQTSAATWWELPGLGFQPDLPPADVVALVGDIRDIAPLLLDYSGVPMDAPPDYDYPEGAAVGWFQAGPDRVKTAALNVYQNEHRASDWSSVLQVAAIAAEAATLFTYNGGERQFRFDPNECTGTIDVTADDRMLVDAMAQSGVALPAGGGAGFCIPAE